MPDLQKRLAGPQQLTTSAATVYTVPASTSTIIRSIHVVNTSAASVTFTLSIGADAAATRFFSALAVAANGVLDWSGFAVVNAAEVIQAFAGTATALTLTISGVEVT